MPIPRIAVAASALLLSAALLAAPALAGGELFGRAYVSTSVKKDGKRYELYKDTRLRVDHESGNRDVVRWRAGCNFFGAEFEAEDNRIITGDAESSEMACSPERRERQDRFFLRFFKADPAYVTSGNGLQLRTEAVVIDLLRRP